MSVSNAKRSKIHEILLKTYPNCWGCGGLPETKHHFPPRCMTPKMMIKIPMCKKCHKKLNTGLDYTAKERRSLRANVRKIEKSVKNIRRNLLDKESYITQSDKA